MRQAIFRLPAPVPAEVKNPSPPSLTERASCAGSHSVVFPASAFKHPQHRA